MPGGPVGGAVPGPGVPSEAVVFRPQRRPSPLDDAVRARLRRLSLSAGPDPVGRLVPGHHLADASDAAVGSADHGVSREEFEEIIFHPHAFDRSRSTG